MPEDYRYMWPGMESPDGTETASGGAEGGRAEETLENFVERDGAAESGDASFPGETDGGTPPFTFNGNGIRQRRVTTPSGKVPEDERRALHDSAVADLDTYTSAAYDAVNGFANSGALDELRGLRRGSWNPFGWLASGHSPKDDPYTDANGNYIYDPSGAFADPYGNRYLSNGQYQDMLGRQWRDIRQAANNDPWVLARRYLYAESADKLLGEINDISQPMFKVMTGGLGAVMPAFLYAEGFDRTGWSGQAQVALDNISAAEYLLRGSKDIVESGPGIFMGMRQASINPDTYTLGMMNATVIRPAVKALNRHLEGLGDGSRTDGLTNDEMILLQALAMSSEMNSFMQPLVTGTGVKGGKGIVDLIVSSLELWGAFEAVGAIANPIIEKALAKVFWRFATLDTERFTAGMRAFVERPDIFERLSPMQKEAVRRGGAEFLEEFGNEDMLRQICAFTGKSYSEVAEDIWAHSYGAGFNPDEFMFERGGRTYRAKKTGRNDLPTSKGTRIEGDYIISETAENQGLKMPHDEKIPLLSEEQMGKVVENKSYMEQVGEAARPKTQIGDSGVEFVAEPKPEAGATPKAGKTGTAATEVEAGTRGGAVGEEAKIKDVPPDDYIPPSSGGAAAEPEPEEFKSRFTSVSEDLFTTDGTGSTVKGRIVNVYDGDGTLVGKIVEDGRGGRRVTYSRSVGDPVEEMQKRVISIFKDKWAESQNVGIAGNPKAQAVTQEVCDMFDRVKKQARHAVTKGKKFARRYKTGRQVEKEGNRIFSSPYMNEYEKESPLRRQAIEKDKLMFDLKKQNDIFAEKIDEKKRISDSLAERNKNLADESAKLKKESREKISLAYKLLELTDSSIPLDQNNFSAILTQTAHALPDLGWNELSELYRMINEFRTLEMQIRSLGDTPEDERKRMDLTSKKDEIKMRIDDKFIDSLIDASNDLDEKAKEIDDDIASKVETVQARMGDRLSGHPSLTEFQTNTGFYIEDDVLKGRIAREGRGGMADAEVKVTPRLTEDGLWAFDTEVKGEIAPVTMRKLIDITRRTGMLPFGSALLSLLSPYLAHDVDLWGFLTTLNEALPETKGFRLGLHSDQLKILFGEDGTLGDIFSGAFGEGTAVDANLFKVDPDTGFIMGYYALEYMRIYHRDEFERIYHDLMQANRQMNGDYIWKILQNETVFTGHTPEEVMETLTGTSKPISEMSDEEIKKVIERMVEKTIFDVFDTNPFKASDKAKFLNRPFMLIYYADTPETCRMLHNGMECYFKSLLSSDFVSPPDLSATGIFSDRKANVEFLKKCGCKMDIADSPEKMQLLFEYIYATGPGMFTRMNDLVGKTLEEAKINMEGRDPKAVKEAIRRKYVEEEKKSGKAPHEETIVDYVKRHDTSRGSNALGDGGAQNTTEMDFSNHVAKFSIDLAKTRQGTFHTLNTPEIMEEILSVSKPVELLDIFENHVVDLGNAEKISEEIRSIYRSFFPDKPSDTDSILESLAQGTIDKTLPDVESELSFFATYAKYGYPFFRGSNDYIGLPFYTINSPLGKPYPGTIGTTEKMITIPDYAGSEGTKWNHVINAYAVWLNYSIFGETEIKISTIGRLAKEAQDAQDAFKIAQSNYKALINDNNARVLDAENAFEKNRQQEIGRAEKYAESVRQIYKDAYFKMMCCAQLLGITLFIATVLGVGAHLTGKAIKSHNKKREEFAKSYRSNNPEWDAIMKSELEILNGSSGLTRSDLTRLYLDFYESETQAFRESRRDDRRLKRDGMMSYNPFSRRTDVTAP